MVGLIEPTHLTPTWEFAEKFPDFLSLVNRSEIQAFADEVLRVHPECALSVKHFVPWFLIEFTAAASEFARAAAVATTSAILRAHLHNVNVPLGVVAIMVHQQRYGVPTIPKCESKGWQDVVAPDGAKYKVLHDTGQYAAYKASLTGKLDLTPP